MDDRISIDLWLTKEQFDLWAEEAVKMETSIYEYIRKATSAYYTIIHQHDIGKE